MIVKVKLHGILSDLAGKKELQVENIRDLNGLRGVLSKEYSILSKYLFRIAVNNMLANENIPIKEGDCIDLIPPFPGG
ncbi:MAG: MoaD/ThiS family protein [Bacteroidales bacterium]